MAAGEVAGRYFAQRWSISSAAVDGVAAARMEVAAGRRRGGAGHFAAQDAVGGSHPRVGDRNGTHEGGGVGVPRRAKISSVGASSTSWPTYITAMRSEMWRTTERSCATKRKVRSKPRLQFEQQVQHLRLDRDVECGDRLVGHDQARAGGERAGDADALALAATEGVRKAVHEFGAQADEAKQFGDPVDPLAAVAACR